MAAEKKNGLLSRLDNRQKVIGIIFVVIILIILWQIMGLFGGGGTPETAETPPPTENMTATAPQASAEVSVPPINSTGQPTAMPKPAPIQKTITLDTVAISEFEKQTQEDYMKSLNKLQMLRIQRDIAETDQAIATAKLATVTAEKSVSELLTKPAPPTVPISSYSGALVNPTQSGTLVTPPATTPADGTPPSEQPATPPPTTVVVQPEAQYSVISVSMQMGKWSAVLGYQGKLISVTIGDILPADKSVVLSISRDAVVLEKGGKKRKISIISSI